MTGPHLFRRITVSTKLLHLLPFVNQAGQRRLFAESTRIMAASAKPGHELLHFINAAPTPFHAVHLLKEKLCDAGFREILERDDWQESVKPGGKYVLTRNASTLVAFAVGEKWEPGNPFSMVGAHTDSPALRVKPVSKKQGEGFLQVGVETYGGGIWHTWFDRDLSLAGRLMIKTREDRIIQKLVKIDRPILRIPTLAIHLERKETFEFNKETQLLPIAGLVAAELNQKSEGKASDASNTEKSLADKFDALTATTESHHPQVIQLLAREAKVEASAILDFELLLYDTQKSCVGGLNEELVFSPRLDNLEMSFCATQGLIKSTEAKKSLQGDETIRLIALFDHEEIGSRTPQGADSNVLPTILRRLCVDPDVNNTAYEQSLARSFLISADMAHSVHPNYASKYEADHKPLINKGPVFKVNANQRYVTNSPGLVLLRQIANEAEVPMQMFVVRNDSSCGSTIGPMLSAALGTRTVDMGNPQLSMHSIRETGGVYDVDYAVRLFDKFFERYSALESDGFVSDEMTA